MTPAQFQLFTAMARLLRAIAVNPVNCVGVRDIDDAMRAVEAERLRGEAECRQPTSQWHPV